VRKTTLTTNKGENGIRRSAVFLVFKS